MIQRIRDASRVSSRGLHFLLGSFLLLGFWAPVSAHESYVVQGGDTTSELAVEFDTSLLALVGLNGLADPDHIYVGQHLRIPSDASPRYVVRPGDTLSGIAAAHELSASALAAANGIANPNRLWAGRALMLSEHAPALPSVGNAGTHTVRWSETLSQIAEDHGVSVDALTRANGISDPDWIRAGVTLSIPGGWLCPVRGPLRFVDDFGVVKPDGRVHEGVDLYAPRGAPVVAPVPGRVVRTTGRIGGRQLSLHGRDGHRYFYSHLDRFGEGGAVGAGSVVGYVGDSGNARGAPTHLHFELHPGGGAPANPYPVLSDAC